MRLRVLDLFCGAGGAAKGYHDGFTAAGFDVDIVGLDINPQPNYPYEFVQADAMALERDVLDKCWHENSAKSSLPGRLARCLGRFDFIHASPPCQAYSTLAALHDVNYPDLYVPTRERLQAVGVPWVIENVIGAPYRGGVVLCGSMFGMMVRRHRNFESNVALLVPSCDHPGQGTPLGVYGYGGGGKMTRGVKARPSQFADLMGMPWAKPREIVQAIPPAYTGFLAEQIAPALMGRAA